MIGKGVPEQTLLKTRGTVQPSSDVYTCCALLIQDIRWIFLRLAWAQTLPPPDSLIVSFLFSSATIYVDIRNGWTDRELCACAFPVTRLRTVMFTKHFDRAWSGREMAEIQ